MFGGDSKTSDRARLALRPGVSSRSPPFPRGKSYLATISAALQDDTDSINAVTQVHLVEGRPFTMDRAGPIRWTPAKLQRGLWSESCVPHTLVSALKEAPNPPRGWAPQQRERLAEDLEKRKTQG